MGLGYFIKKEDKILVNADYVEAYVPEKYFKKGLNEVMGDKITIMGIFNFRVGNKDGVITNNKLHTFKLPTMMITKPNSIEVKELELTNGSGSQKYKVMKYFKGDELMTSTKIVTSIDNVEKFVNLLIAGNLPNTINYSEILNLFLKNITFNKQKLGISALILSVVISEIYRYKKDMSLPFRKVIGAGKANELDYIAANARTVCSSNSTFSALTFEDPNTMLVTSINKLRYNKKENPSPVEKIIRI